MLLNQIFRTKIGWLCISILLAGLSTWIVPDDYEQLVLGLLLTYPVGLTLVFIYSAWFKNGFK